MMNPADDQVLKVLEPFMSDLGFRHVVTQVEKAGGIRNLTDTTALAELEMAKRKFSSRSAAASYAASVRWQGKKGEFETPGPKGERVRTRAFGNSQAQFEVTDMKAGNAKVGDIVSFGSNRVPNRVLGITPKGDRLEMRHEGLDTSKGRPPVMTTLIRPDANLRSWTLLETEKAERKSFGGDRSAAGRYAAEARWARQRGGSEGATAAGGSGGSGGSGGGGDEIPGASEIRGLTVDYSETPGRRMKDTTGRYVTYEREYVEARKAKQDFDDEVADALSSVAGEPAAQVKVIRTQAKAFTAGLTKTTNQIGDTKRIETRLPSTLGLETRMARETIFASEGIKRAIARVNEAAQRAALRLREIVER